MILSINLIVGGGDIYAALSTQTRIFMVAVVRKY